MEGEPFGPARDRRARSPLRFWAIVAVCWLAWGVLYTVKLDAVKVGATLPEVLQYAFSDAILWALFTPLVFWLARRFPVRSPRVPGRLLLHLCIGICVAFVVLLLDGLQNQWLYQGDGRPPTAWEFLGFSFFSRMHSNLMVYGVVLAAGQVIEHQRRLVESERALGDLRADLAEARLRALRSQLQPHFLFNCLNTISGLVESRPAEARRMIGQLAQLLRIALKTHVEESIPLRDELELVRAYLALEKARFGDRLRVEIDVPRGCEELQVPAFLLQPLVENAVRHGIASKVSGGTVRMVARRTDRRLHLSVEDDGVGMARRNGDAGLGLSSVRSRLAGLYGDDQSCEVRTQVGGGTAVSIAVPATGGSEEATVTVAMEA